MWNSTLVGFRANIVQDDVKNLAKLKGKGTFSGLMIPHTKPGQQNCPHSIRGAIHNDPTSMIFQTNSETNGWSRILFLSGAIFQWWQRELSSICNYARHVFGAEAIINRRTSYFCAHQAARDPSQLYILQGFLLLPGKAKMQRTSLCWKCLYTSTACKIASTAFHHMTVTDENIFKTQATPPILVR